MRLRRSPLGNLICKETVVDNVVNNIKYRFKLHAVNHKVKYIKRNLDSALHYFQLFEIKTQINFEIKFIDFNKINIKESLDLIEIKGHSILVV